ncbi:MAG TPA: 50S ribosomal protein L4 [Candidatus Saccharimonadales bacterium]|nr:50S ribosomal protein L4 [Candidatus Saccharimonadales bacterium]
MAVATFTKSGTKSSSPAKLDKAVFGVDIRGHQLLKDAYLSYLAGGRAVGAKTKRRGEVRGGGRKPWRQKGTGNARFGSSRNPIWRGGGIAFGPTGSENFTRKLSLSAKRKALCQALTLAAKEDRIKVIESFGSPHGKVKPILQILKKLSAEGNVLLVAPAYDAMLLRSTNNLSNVTLAQAKYLNVYLVMNADTIVVSKESLEIISQWLGGTK